MSDLLDIVTLAEAKPALNIAASDVSNDAELAVYITAVSRRIDDLCGPVVIRTVTSELYDTDGPILFLRQAPVSAKAATTITTVTEYVGGVAQVLTAEQLTAASSNDFLFDQQQGTLTRRASFATRWWSTGTRVAVTYQPGRYANTAAVDPLFKAAANAFLNHVWNALGTDPTAAVAPVQEGQAFGVPGFAVPRFVTDMLALELRPPALA